jgi:predicted GNAT superfamily acetyltransferase
MQAVDIAESDLAEVLALNEASVPHVSRIDMEAMRWFARKAEYFRIVRLDTQLAGFLIGLGPGLDYASPNYRWFTQRHPRFGYVDRVAVAPDARRLGIASLLYEDYTSRLRGRVPVITCEVNLRPPNESSMAYHEGQGFRRVGAQETEGGKKEVALLEKML